MNAGAVFGIFQSTVEDASNNPVLVSGTAVNFTAPASGASGTFANGTDTTSATTDSDGVATATIFTANSQVGGYSVTAASTGLASATFTATNVAGSASKIVIQSGGGQSRAVGLVFSTPLNITVEDANSNPVLVSGTTVTFTAPSSGASGTFVNGTDTTSATTDSDGVATATAFTANTVAGIYSVTAVSADWSRPPSVRAMSPAQPHRSL